MSDFIFPMTIEDVEYIAEIEKECFSAPWSLEAIKAELNNPHARFFVYKVENKVLGYIGCHFVCDEASIANVAVSKEHRRNKIGENLIYYLINKAKEENISSIYLEVRNSNIAAQNLYKKCGFSVCGTRRNFYSSPREDAVLMKFTLTNSGDNL